MRKYIIILQLALTLVCQGCSKDWLNEKRDIKLIVPETLSDLRLLLNNGLVLPFDNTGIAEISSDEFYLADNYWESRGQDERLAYIWTDVFKGSAAVPEWDNAYKQIEICNVVLEAIGNIKPTTAEEGEWKDIKGTALFYRAKAFFNLATVFCAPYGKENMGKPGIYLKLSADINSEVTRATVQATYEHILADLKQSLLLVKHIPLNKDNPSRAAVYGQIARCYLDMSEYIQSGLYADSCLALNNTLLDYNTLNPGDTYPFKRYNDEVILNASLSGNYSSFYAPNSKIPEELIASYSDNDLRKKLFFTLNAADASYSFRGTYLGIKTMFSGLAVDELYLVKAESYARQGKLEVAIKTLNDLLVTRYVTGTYTPIPVTQGDEVLRSILAERRKELVLRGRRWADLRRLNDDPDLAVTVTRTVGGKNYSLLPGSPRYAFPLPDYVISAYNLEQNPGW